MIFVDLLVVLILVYAAYAGTRRGLVLIAIELGSFIIASGLALLAYHPVSGLLRSLFGAPAAVANLGAFSAVWVLTELALALTVHKAVLPHLNHQVQHSWPNKIGGAVLGAAKYTVILALLLIVFAGLPLSAGAKSVITEAAIPKLLLASTSRIQSWLSGGLGHDLVESLNFFTVTAEPESTERVNLGYTTTGTVDPKDEAAMLVLLNHERTSRGLKALTMNPQARAVARSYSTDMFARGYFSHISLEGKSPFDRMKAGGVKFNQAGENLALAPTLQLAHTGLMNSPGHRANILSPGYRTVGIGIIDGGPYGLMVTQDFTD